MHGVVSATASGMSMKNLFQKEKGSFYGSMQIKRNKKKGVTTNNQKAERVKGRTKAGANKRASR
jgi:hypothetical protein